MSVVWLESFILKNNDSSIFSFQSTNILIYLNLISCFCFMVYSLLYNMDYYMQKAPSKKKNFKKIKNLFRFADNFKNVF